MSDDADEPTMTDEHPEVEPDMFSDAVIGEAGLQNLVAAIERGEAPRPTKELISVRLDVDLVEWLRASGPGYQTRLNGMLRKLKDASQGRR